MGFLDQFRPKKLLEHGDRKLDEAGRLLDSVTNPRDRQTVQDSLMWAQELKLKSYVERGMLGRLIQARVYFHKADNVLQNIESIMGQSRNHQLPNGNTHYSS
jgi:hypothetical protein